MRAGLVAIVLAGSGGTILRARTNEKLFIEPLRGPPSPPKRGLLRTVLASLLLDRMNGLAKWTDPYSLRKADALKGDWVKEMDVKIPEADVSLSDFESNLRRWFGSERHITGDIFKVPVPGKPNETEIAMV